MRRQLMILSLSSLALGCSQENNTHFVSGPSYCKDFTSQRINTLSGKKDIESVRALRDLYMDCDVSGQHQTKAFELAKLAAKMGDKSDKETCQMLVEYHNTGAIQPKLIAGDECAL